MYRWSILVWITAVMALVSCTTRGPPVTAPIIPTVEIGIKPETLSPVPAVPELEPPLTMDDAVKQVKANSPEIIKSFTTDSAEDAFVFGDIRGYRVVYDLRNAVPQDEGRFLVAFSVEDPVQGETRDDFLLWAPEEDKAGVLLSMDDDYYAAWEAYFDTFDRYGAKITFFVQGEAGPFCQEAWSRGHDIGYHTLHHLNLTKVSREEFHTETLAGIDGFRHTGIPLGSFAYPFGLSEPWMLDALSPFFSLQRGYGVLFHIYRGERISRYIVSTAIDNILFQEDGEFERTLFRMLFITKFLGKDHIAPFTTHNISDAAQWGIKPARLEYLLQTIGDFKLKFYLFSDFVRPVIAQSEEPPPEPSAP